MVMFTIENLAEINENVGHVFGQTMLKNFAAQIKQRLDITDSCSRYSLDRILVVLHNADIESARRFATRLERELRFEDLLTIDNGFAAAIIADVKGDYFSGTTGFELYDILQRLYRCIREIRRV